MSNINDRVSYLKGLAEGMKLTDDTNQNKLLLKMLDVLDEIAQELTSLRSDYEELDEYVESIDDDLADMEEYLFDDEDEEDDDEDEDDDQMVMECPHCHSEVTFDVDGFDYTEENLCPVCGKPLFPEEGNDGDE